MYQQRLSDLIGHVDCRRSSTSDLRRLLRRNRMLLAAKAQGDMMVLHLVIVQIRHHLFPDTIFPHSLAVAYTYPMNHIRSLFPRS